MSNRAAGTSVVPMMIAAVETLQPPERRLLTDDLALGVLPRPLRPFVRWPAAQRWVQGMSDKRSPGMWNSLACRKRYLDDLTTSAIDAGLDAVVVLGAGLDTRACRLAATAGIPAFEVDLPVNITRKRQRITLPASITAAPIDFETEDLTATLIAHGYDPNAKTLFLWEGVTQYLTEKAVRTTLTALADAAPGSTLGFTYVQQDFLDGTNYYDTESTYKQFVGRGLWQFGLRPAQVPDLLAEYGWREVEQVGAHEYTTRYLQPAGRTDITDLERCVHAQKS